MAHVPQHPDNPCRLPPAEQVPAKIWELLRRNDRFQRTVARLQELDAAARAAGLDAARGAKPAKGQRKAYYDAVRSYHISAQPAWAASDQMVRALRRRHPFAAAALEWLVPEPLFRVTHWALYISSDAQPDQAARLQVVCVAEGTTPDPDDRAHWRTFSARGGLDAESLANRAGPLRRRGPIIEQHTSANTRLADKVDPIAEWRDYFARRQFTLKCPWRKAPPGLKRHFRLLWAQLCSSGEKQITWDRGDVPQAHETTFFEGWRLADALARAASQGSICPDDLARALQFDDLARHYRVFAIPRPISRQDAKSSFAVLASQVAANLPDTHSILGTPGQWDVFLGIMGNRREDHPKFVKKVITRWLKQYYYTEGVRSFRDVRQASETDVTSRVDYLRGLRDRLFPLRENLTDLFTPMQHRRSRR